LAHLGYARCGDLEPRWWKVSVYKRRYSVYVGRNRHPLSRDAVYYRLVLNAVQQHEAAKISA
jgi:hypothetical protein